MENIERLIKKLPAGYEEACYKEKAIQRKRGISSPKDLMMLSLFHLINGCSLKEISNLAKMTKLGNISDVAFMERFENCNDWFKWINERLITESKIVYEKPPWLEPYRVLAVDASDVTEKGRSGRIYRLHYALDLYGMQSAEYKITTQQTGERLCNFELKQNDLVIADRMYSTLTGIDHCRQRDSQYILRLRKNSFTLYEENGDKVNLLDMLKIIKDGEILDFWSYAQIGAQRAAVRVCAKKKTAEAAERSQKNIISKEQRKKGIYSAEAKQFNNYIVLVTSLENNILPEQILELYRLRWQVEIYFKRLKSILNFGDMPKRRVKSVMAWLNGKIMVALLIEKMIAEQSFSPFSESIP